MSQHLFTIGHSTHPFDRFVALLTQHDIKVLADIRRFPGSRKFPQFNLDHLASALPEAGIEYRWLAAFGGRRGKNTNGLSNNPGLRNESFFGTTPTTCSPRSFEKASGNCSESQRESQRHLCVRRAFSGDAIDGWWPTICSQKGFPCSTSCLLASCDRIR